MSADHVHMLLSISPKRLCRHFLRNLKWTRPILGAKNWRHSLPSAARVRPASAPFPSFAALRTPTGATTNDLTPCRMPLVLSPPPLALRLRQNKRPYGYAGVVVHRSSAAAPSTSMYSFHDVVKMPLSISNKPCKAFPKPLARIRRCSIRFSSLAPGTSPEPLKATCAGHFNPNAPPCCA